jgi:hypothetical protein
VLTQVAHARILYAEKLTPTSVLDVISTQASDLYTSVSYSSCFMMIDTPQNTTYRILLRTKGKDSVGDSLEALLRELRLKLTPHVGKPLYKSFMNILLYSANTIYLNTEKLAQKILYETSISRYAIEY